MSIRLRLIEQDDARFVVDSRLKNGQFLSRTSDKIQHQDNHLKLNNKDE